MSEVGRLKIALYRELLHVPTDQIEDEDIELVYLLSKSKEVQEDLEKAVLKDKKK